MSNSEATQSSDPKKTVNAPPRRPNETGTITVQAHMRIFDPKTQKTYVEGRA